MRELVELAMRHVGSQQILQTRIPELQLIHAFEARQGPMPTLFRPTMCFLAQGAKEISVGDKVFRYKAGEYLVATVDLPVAGEVIEATPKKPYVCIAVSIEPAMVYDVARDLTSKHEPPGRAAISVGRGNDALADAAVRLVRLLDHPEDAAALGRGVVREVIYRLLQTQFGPMVRDIGVSGGRTERLARAITHLKNAFNEPIEVEELARLAGMSVSTFHEHFKKLTTLSPLQYQKQLRLQEARRLLMFGGSGAAEVGFRVGYQSPSQFSREYARFFGHAPSKEGATAVQ